MSDDKSSHWISHYAINVGHLLTTISIAAGAFVYAVTQHERITRLEERSVVHEARLDREMTRTANDLAAIRASQTRMEDRFERYLERQR